MSASAPLLVLTMVVPLAMAAACLRRRLRARMPALLWVASLPALGASIWAVNGPPLVASPARLRITLALDAPGAMLLGAAALLWLTAGIYAWAYQRGEPRAAVFSVYWLLTLSGSLGVFVSADLATFYLAFALASLPAYGLVVHDLTPRARRAAAIYLALAVLAEVFLLFAFALCAVATPGESLAIRDVVAALAGSPWKNLTVALLIAGFGLKAGLVPMHIWLPLAHPAAPMPASAVLSGAIIKAGVIGLIRFLPIEIALGGWGGALAALGLLTAFYGVVVGITQANPKTVLAYSSVSQMGVVAAVFGMGLAQGDGGTAIATSFYALHHVLAKGALFLSVGVIAATGARRLWPVLIPTAVLALGLGGLPLTGGALAKLAVKAPLGEGIVGTLAAFSAAGTTLLMIHFLYRVVTTAAREPAAAAPAGLTAPWLVTAAAAIAMPWMLFATASSGRASDSLAPAELWAALWPVTLGALLALALRFVGPALPRIPEGDVIVVGPLVARAAHAEADRLERVEWLLRQWPVAGVALLALTIILGGVLLAAR